MDQHSEPTKILIIDDNTDLITLVGKILDKRSYQLFDATDGKRGLNQAVTLLPDLILLDVMMPGMNGYDVCRRLKSNPVTRDIMVVMISAIKKGIDNQTDGFDSGADGYIELPISNRELKNRIRTYEKILQNNKRLGDHRGLFEQIFESVQDGIIYASLTGDILALNGAMERILGIPKSRILGMNGLTLARNLLSGRVVKNTLAVITRILSGEDISVFQVEYRDKVLEIAPAVDLPNQRITGMVRDITETVKQAQAIRESEERLRLTLEAISDGVWDWHIPTGKAVFSPGYFTMLGYEPYEFPENYSSWRSLVHPDDLEQTEALIESKMSSGEGYAIEFRLKKKSGQYSWILGRGKVVEQDKQGKPVRMLGTHTDISERKSGEEKLLESENKYRKIFENIQDVFYQVDAAGKIREISPSIYRYSGFTREDLIGKPVEKIYKNPADRKAMLRHLLERGEVTDYDVELKTKSGEVRWASLHTHLQLNDDGTPAGIEGSLRDVTKRKNAEEALRESEEKFRSLAEFTPYAIMIYQDDHWIYANPAGERISGYSAEELCTMRFWDFVDDEFRDLVKERGHQRQQGLSTIPAYELRIVTKSGEKRWVYLNGTTIQYGGKQAGLISVIDITDRKRSEQIQQILYHISDAVTSTRDVQALIRFIRAELGTLMDTSSFYIAFYDPETGLLSTPYNRDEEDDLESWPCDRSLTGRVFRENTPFLITRNDILRLHEAGEIDLIGSLSQCWLGVPLHEEGVVSGSLVVRSFTNPHAYSQRDVEVLEFISDQISISIRRKKAEEELRAALDKARESEQLKSVFLANMSHEIRTPMNAILGFSDLMAQPDATQEEREKFTGIIRNAGSRLMHIIDDIIDLSKLEAGQIQVAKAPCQLGALINQVFESHKQSALLKRKPGLKLLLDLPDNLPVGETLTDCGRVQQVLDNLMTNAIKYTDSGEIRLGLTMNKDETGSWIRFTVSDTGRGIPADKLRFIFERFRQVDEFGYHEGAGLGLSISAMLTELLGGSLEVESVEGQGSTFSFILPCCPVDDQGKAAGPHPAASGDKLRERIILVAEDDEDSYMLITHLLQGTKVHIQRAEDGIVLLKMLENEVPDLILLDINLPGKTGYECLKEIRSKRLPVKVIAQTAYAMADERTRCMAAGADGYLAKPFTRQVLLENMVAVLG